MGFPTKGPLRETINTLALALSDYREAYDMIPHSWIVKCLEIAEKCEKVSFLLTVCRHRRVELELSSSGERVEVIN